jgi:hypothetical protein
MITLWLSRESLGSGVLGVISRMALKLAQFDLAVDVAKVA